MQRVFFDKSAENENDHVPRCILLKCGTRKQIRLGRPSWINIIFGLSGYRNGAQFIICVDTRVRKEIMTTRGFSGGRKQESEHWVVAVAVVTTLKVAYVLLFSKRTKSLSSHHKTVQVEGKYLRQTSVWFR